MSAFSAPTSLARPVAVTAATAILALDALRNFAIIGASLSGTDIPAAVVASQVALGAVELVAAVGLWGLHRWAAALAIVAALLALLTGVLGIFNAGDATGKVISALGIALGIAVIVAVAHPTARRAYR